MKEARISHTKRIKEHGNHPQVFLGECESYDPKKIESVIREGIKLLGVQLPRYKLVLLKPNVLGAYKPEQCVTTHPDIVQAITNILLENKNKVIIGDSSGLRREGGTSSAQEAAGLKKLERKGVSVISFDEKKSGPYQIPDGVQVKEVNLTSLLKEVDCIINLPKLKAHQLTRYTGAVKNLFGCVPGGTKQQYHVTSPDPESFAELIIDIYSAMKPMIILNIMDGIIGLEGLGPGPTGTPKKSGIIAISTDALALDICCSSFIGEKPESILTNKIGLRRGLTTKNIKVIGNPAKVKFWLPKPLPLTGFFYKHFAGFASSRPVIDMEKCRKCGMCAKVCPPKAIKMKGYPEIDRDKCIYCYCCHENCPFSAIELHDNILLRIFKKLCK